MTLAECCSQWRLHCPALRRSFPLRCETAAGPPSHRCQTHAAYRRWWDECVQDEKERNHLRHFLKKHSATSELMPPLGRHKHNNAVSLETVGRGRKWTTPPTTGSQAGIPLCRHQPSLRSSWKTWTETIWKSNTPQRELQRLKHLAGVDQILWR